MKWILGPEQAIRLSPTCVEEEENVFPVCHVPVSYTHLDVYKRQGYIFSKLIQSF